MSEHVCSCGGNCGCGETDTGGQVYLTREQYIVRLENYLGELKVEIASVEGELMELRREVLPQAVS